MVDVEVNPASNIKSRIEERPGTRWLNAAEIKSLAPHLEALPPAKRDALKLILLTGQRPAKLRGCDAGEVDLVKGVWTIPAERSKNKRDMRYPCRRGTRHREPHLIENARKDELDRHGDRLFLVRARGVRPLQVNNLNWSLRSALIAAGVAPGQAA